MKNLLFPFIIVWKEAETFVEYVVALWITILLLLFVVGWTGVVWHIITDPSSVSNATFGIFDYL